MKLFTKADNAKLFANYSKGSNMANQNVVVKIFNPYNKGTWFIMNSDPNDPDYLWGIADLGYGAEVGSISRSDLENYRNRFGWGFERDMSFRPKNAKMVLEGLRNGEFFAEGGGVRKVGNREYSLGRNWTNDHNHTNKSEKHEVAYSRKGFFDGGGEVEFIDYGDSEIMFEPNSKKYYANDMEFDTLKEAKKFIDSGEVPEHIRDAYSKGLFADGGAIKNQYEGRTPENVWKNLSKGQRSHFLYDHMDEIQGIKNIDRLPTSEVRVAYNSDWMSLDKDIKNRFANHVREGEYKKGGALLSPKQRYIAELKGLTGLQQKAIEDYIDENNLTSDEVLRIVIGLGRKQISRSDVSTAIVGKKNNSESKKLLAFAMSDEALKAEYGAFMDGVYAGGGSISNFDPMSLIGKTFYSLQSHGKIINVRILSNDNIKIKYEVSNTFSVEKSFTKKELFDMAKGKEVDGNSILKSTMAYGGKTTFAEKSSAIAKNFVGKAVEPKYQKEYGKRYDTKEAKEVGNKIAGKQKASYDKKNMKSGGSVKSDKLKQVTQKAKEIRKEGEKWQSAMKRAYAMMK